MTTVIDVDPDLRLSSVCWQGVIGISDIERGEAAQLGHGLFEKAFKQFIYAPKGTLLKLSSRELRMLASGPPMFSPSSRRAFLAEDYETYLTGEAFSEMREGVAGEIGIFEKLDAASEYLDIPASVLGQKINELLFKVERGFPVLSPTNQHLPG